MIRLLRGDRGVVGGIEVLPFSLLVLVAGALLVTSIWGVVDAKVAAGAAAREATRWVAESATASTPAQDIDAGAAAIAAATLADHGRTGPSNVTVSAAEGTERCARVRVVVELRLPAVQLPFLSGVGREVAVRAGHTELIDPTRSGVGGPAGCLR